MLGEPAIWEIATPLFAVLLGAVLSRFYDRRPKLLQWILHAGQVDLEHSDGTKQSVRTHVLVLRNAGKKPAENVRISHNALTQFSIYPAVEHSVEQDAEGPGGVIVIPRMLPNETINVNYLYFKEHVSGIHAGTRHDEGFATEVRVSPNRQYPAWFNILMAIVTVIGFATVIYFALQLGILIHDVIALVR